MAKGKPEMGLDQIQSSQESPSAGRRRRKTGSRTENNKVTRTAEETFDELPHVNGTTLNGSHLNGKTKKGSFSDTSPPENGYEEVISVIPTTPTTPNGKRNGSIIKKNGSRIGNGSEIDQMANNTSATLSPATVSDSTETKRGSWIKRIGAIATTTTPQLSPSRTFHSYPTSPSTTPRTSPIRRRAISVSDVSSRQSPPTTSTQSAPSTSSRPTEGSSLANRFGLKGFSKRGSKILKTSTSSPAIPTPVQQEAPAAEDAKEITEIVSFFQKEKEEEKSSNGSTPDLATSLSTALQLPMKLQSLTRLIELSKKDSNKLMLGKSLDLFVSYLDNDNTALHSSTLQLIRNLVTIEPLKHRFRVIDGFPPLVRVLKTGDDNAQKLAVACVGFLLSGSESNADSFIDAGGVEPLVQLLKSPAEIVQLLAAGVTWVLAAREKRHQEAVLHSGGHVLLLDLLATANNIDIQWQVAGAIRNLALKNDHIQHTLFQLGTVQVLLRRLETTTNEKVIGHLTAAMLALSEHLKVQEFMRENDGFTTIFNIINNQSYSHAIRELGLSILKALIHGNVCNQRFILQKPDVLDLILRLMEYPHEGVRNGAAQALETLAEGNSEATECINEKGVLQWLIIHRLPTETHKMIVAIHRCIGVLCTQSEANRSLLLNGNHLPGVLKFLSDASAPELQESVAQLVVKLAPSDERFITSLGEYVPTLLDCLLGSDLGVVENAVRALCILLQNEAVVKKNVQSANRNKGSIINRLVSFMLYEQEEELQINSCKLLRMLAVDDQIKASTLASGGVLVFIRCLSFPSVNLALESLLTTETIVEQNSKLQNIWREQGVFAKLSSLLTLSRMDVVARTLSATQTLCFNNAKSHDAARNAGLFSQALRLISSNNAEVTEEVVVKALGFIEFLGAEGSMSKIRSLILKTAGGLEGFLTNLREGRSEKIVFHTLSALAVLGKKTKFQNAFRMAHGLEVLTPLCLNENQRIASCAFSVILALCTKNPINRDAFRQLGLVETLRGLSAFHPSPSPSSLSEDELALFRQRLEETKKMFK